jgi:hypothetical protein
MSIPTLSAREQRILISLVHSLICSYRTFKVKAKPDSITITAPYSGRKTVPECIDKYFSDTEIDAFISRYLKKEKIVSPNELFIYSGNASSPNGGHSSINYLADCAGLYKDRTLFENVMNLALCFKNGSALKNIVDVLVVNFEYDKEYSKDKIHSRIVTFTAAGGKA